MVENTDELVDLLVMQYLGKLAPEDNKRLEELLSNSDLYKKVVKNLSAPGTLDAPLKQCIQFREKFRQFEREQEKETKGILIHSKFWRISIAASVFLVLAIGAYFWKNTNRTTTENAVTLAPNERPADLAPGKHKAILTLAGGEQLILDSAAIGKLTDQGNTKIINEGGHIIYNPSGELAGEVLYNTLTTAKGEMYSLVLPDNSRVWLNSGSSIRFPVAFKGSERKVEITGEVYFEVTHKRNMPFKVTVNEAEIEVVGTSFNINAYLDEPSLKTTLLEGIVKVKTSNNQPIFLKPGQQAQVKGSELKVTSGIDVQQAVAWKNGYFQFNRDELQTVMRQIARWYDVEVVYEGDIPKRVFGGRIHRNTNASEILEILESNSIHFKIDGKKIIVTP